MTSTYAEADAFLHTRGKSVPRKKAANNTYLVRLDPTSEGHTHIAVVLHKTAVLTYFDPASVAGGQVMQLNTGGWFTVTTKERINRFLPISLYVGSIKGRWFVSTRDSGVGGSWEHRTLAPFNDGMVVSREADRWITDSHDTTNDAEAANAILRYVRAYTQAKLDTTEPFEGDPDTDRNALLAFIQTKPFSFPYSIVYAAIETRGYRYPELIFGMESSVRSALRRYLRERLLTASEGAKPASSREAA